MEKDLSTAFADLKEDDVLDLVNSRRQGGGDLPRILEDCWRGMSKVMERYESREYYQDSVVAALELYKAVNAALEPSLPKERCQFLGKVVIGTVQNDIHKDGKNLMSAMLESVGFQVFDLGVDVPPQNFVEELQRTSASILCLSGMVGSCFDSMKETVRAVRQAGLKPKIVIGGGITTEELKKYVEADAQTRDMVEGARICLGFVK